MTTIAGPPATGLLTARAGATTLSYSSVPAPASPKVFIDAPAGAFTIKMVIPTANAPQITLRQQVRVSIFGRDGKTFICEIPRRRGVEWQEELNAPGTGKFDMHLDDPVLVEYPDALEYFNIVVFTLNGRPIKAWQIESRGKAFLDSGEVASRFVSVSGRGVLSLLEAAVVYPEYGFRAYTGEDRNFDYSAKDGEWRDPTEWKKPVGAAKSVTRIGYPKNWPDPSAQWLWSTNPRLAAPAGYNWFRSKFTLKTATTVIIYATADDALSVSLDGSVVLVSTQKSGVTAYKTMYKTTQHLAPGEHTIAARALNFGNTPAGFILSMYQADASGARTNLVLLRSLPTTFSVKAYGKAPGWRGASVLRQLLDEAKLRHVESLTGVDYSFTNKVDTSGKAWPDTQNRLVKIGTTDLYTLAQEIIELSLDLEIDPTLTLNAWQDRGSDKSATVIIRPGRDIISASSSGSSSKLKNHSILQSEQGWMELSDASSKEDFGRREVGISVGNATSVDQLALVGIAAMREVARPEVTIPVSYTSIKGPQPYDDYTVGDTITIPDDNQTLSKARVMAITGSESETYISWAIDAYPVVPDDKIDSTVIGANSGASGATSALYRAEILSDSPWAYWRFRGTSGNFGDESGHKRTLSIEGATTGVTHYIAGPIEKAVGWANGTTTYGRTGVKFGFRYASVAAWVFISANPTVATGIVSMGPSAAPGSTSGHDKNLYLRKDGKVSWYVYGGAGHAVTITTPAALSTGIWHYVVATIGASGGSRIYVDGKLVVRSTAVKTSLVTGQYVFVRAGSSIDNGRAGMRTAEVAVFYQELASARIASHWRASSALG